VMERRARLECLECFTLRAPLMICNLVREAPTLSSFRPFGQWEMWDGELQKIG